MFKDILDSSGMSCYRVSELSHVSYTAINEIYRGERSIEECSVSTAKSIASVFHMTLDEFCMQCERREIIPQKLYRCFWDTDPKQLETEKDKTYIITRLLEKGGYDGLAFVKKAYAYEEVKEIALHSRNLSPKTASFLKNIFNLKQEEMIYFSKNIMNWRK